MPLIEHDHVIQQVSSATPDPALSNTVLPWTAKGSAYRLASQVFRTGDHVVAKLGVTVEQEESVRWHVRPCLSHLLRDPKSVGSARHVAAENLAPIMPDDEKAIQKAEGERRDCEE